MREQFLPTTGHPEYNGLAVSIDHYKSRKAMVLNVAPAIRDENGVISIVVTDGHYTNLADMPRLNRKTVEATQEAGFNDIKNKNPGKVFEQYSALLNKYGMTSAGEPTGINNFF